MSAPRNTHRQTAAGGESRARTRGPARPLVRQILEEPIHPDHVEVLFDAREIDRVRDEVLAAARVHTRERRFDLRPRRDQRRVLIDADVSARLEVRQQPVRQSASSRSQRPARDPTASVPAREEGEMLLTGLFPQSPTIRRCQLAASPEAVRRSPSVPRDAPTARAPGPARDDSCECRPQCRRRISRARGR